MFTVVHRSCSVYSPGTDEHSVCRATYPADRHYKLFARAGWSNGPHGEEPYARAGRKLATVALRIALARDRVGAQLAR